MIDKSKQLIQDYKTTFSSDHGKRVYDDLMEKCRMNSSAHDVDSANLTFVLAGMRDVAILIKNAVEYNFSKEKPKTAGVEKEPITT